MIKSKKGDIIKNFSLKIFFYIFLFLIIFLSKSVSAATNYNEIWDSFLNSSNNYVAHSIRPDDNDELVNFVVLPIDRQLDWANTGFNIQTSNCTSNFSSCTFKLYKSNTYVDSRVVSISYEDLNSSIINLYNNYASEMESTLSYTNILGINIQSTRLFILDDLELYNKNMISTTIPQYDSLKYEEELNSLYDDPNLSFQYIPRVGDGTAFYSYCKGNLYFLYNDVIVSSVSNISVLEANIIYIPQDTDNTSEAYISAAKKRIKDNLGIEANIELGGRRSTFSFNSWGEFNNKNELFASLGTDEELGDYWYNVTFNGVTKEYLISANDNPSHNYCTSNSSDDPSDDPINPIINNEKQIKIIAPTKFLKFGTSMHLNILGVSDNLLNTDVIWESSNEDIANVNSEGGVSSTRNTGIVTITATSKTDSNLSDSITIYVGQYSVELGKQINLGDNWYTGHSEAQWAIEDDSLFEIVNSYTRTVSGQAGTVYTHTLILKASKTGYTKVSMNTITGDRIIDYHVYVYNPIKKIESNTTDLIIEKGYTKKIELTVTPDNVTEELNKLIYVSDDPSIARVDQEGNINAIKEGSTNIIVYSQYSDVSLTIPVNVVIYTESLNVDSSNIGLSEDNKTHQIVYEVLPEDATNKNVTFESNDESVATVSETGLITAVNNGETTITVKTEDGKQTKEISVTVSGIRKSIVNLDYSDINDIDYTGIAITPEIVIHDGEYQLVKDIDYTVIYSNNVEVGTATVLVEGKGYYKGQKELTFNILEPIVVSLESGNDSIDFGEEYINFDNNIQKTLTITNTSNVAVKLSVSNPVSDGPFISLGFENNRVLQPNETYIIILAAGAGRNYSDTPGIYIGNYIFTATTLDDAESYELVVPATLTLKKYPMNVSYTTHVQNVGWQNYVKNGDMAGTSGQALRLEGIKIKINNPDYDGDIEYRTHVQNLGWQDYVKNDEMSGTSGRALRLEAIQIRLTGELAEHYDIYYRVHAQNFGWMSWAKNDELSGTAGYGYRLEGIEIVLVEKGENPPAITPAYKYPFKQVNDVPSGALIKYTTHVQNVGWQNYSYDGLMAGTSGQALRLEGIKIVVLDKKYSGDVEYRTHVQNIGWQDYVKNDEMSGTSGRALRLEAIQIRLTGELAEHYDIYYRVHAQNFGWLGWAKNDEMSGTAGYAYRLEGIEIQLVEKGKKPVENGNANNNKPFYQS